MTLTKKTKNNYRLQLAMQNNLIFFILLLVLVTFSYIFTALYAQGNTSLLRATISTFDGREFSFIVNSTEQLKDIIISLANKTDLKSSASTGDLPIAVNNTIIDKLSSAKEIFKSKSTTEGISEGSVSVCSKIPFVGMVCL
jgi:hypothetical protein